MLIRPCRVSAGCMYHAKDGIGPNKVPGIDRSTALSRIAYQPPGINRLNSSVHSSGRAAAQHVLVDVDSFVVLGGSSGRCAIGDARTSCKAVSRGLCRWSEGAVVGIVIECAYAARRATRHQGHQARKGIGGL